MRNLETAPVQQHRDVNAGRARYGTAGNSENGVFVVPSPIDKRPLLCVASCGACWDHISVSRRDRIPLHEEMAAVKALFFTDHETVMELHVPASEHIDFHPRCLHLWRPQDVEIPRPPGWMVGPPRHRSWMR